jgi:DNA polymerase/3'-5' exonuclease PolX
VVTRQGIGNIIACRTEEEIFEALGLTFVEPKFREVPY